MTAVEQWVVRVRIPRANAWPSKPMTRGEAVAIAASLRDLVRDEGDAAGFVEFAAHGGRVIHVRAREVLSVEVDQWRPKPAEQERQGAVAIGTTPLGSTTTTFVVPPDPPADEDRTAIEAARAVSATEFLRRQTAQRSPR